MRAQFIAAARALVGTPYQHRGRLPGIALDCVGVVVLAAAACGVTIPEPAPYGTVPTGLLAGLARSCDPVEIAQPGDVLAILWAGEPRHLGILVGGDRMVHARARCGMVSEETLRRGYRVHSAWRVRGLV